MDTLPSNPTVSPRNNPTISVPTNLDNLALEIAELIHGVASPNLLAPAAFIDEFIDKAVQRSTLSDEQKSRITSATMIEVEYREQYVQTPGGWLGASNPIPPLKVARYALKQIVTDYFRHDFKTATGVRIRWPAEFPQELRRLFDTVDLQERYRTQVDAYFSRPKINELSILLMQLDVDTAIRRYAEGNPSHADFQTLASDYLNGKVEPQLVEFQGATKVGLERAVFLPRPATEKTGVPDGLLVFLGEQDQQAVYEIPRDATRRRALIEGNAALRGQILARIPLYHRLKTGNETVRYRQTFSKTLGRLIWTPPLVFQASEDIGQALFNLSYQRLLSDIDTLVSTDTERRNDLLLEYAGLAMSFLALGVTMPLGVGLLPARLAVGFLMSLGSAATDGVRASLADLPQDAANLYRAAIVGAALEIIGPFAQRMAGRALSTLNKSRVALKVKNLLKTGKGAAAVPPQMIAAIQQANSSKKLHKLELKLDAEFKTGPKTAQLWVDGRGRFLTRRIEPYDITIYRGCVFRGDLRDPELVFKQGFKLRTPAAELQKDIHQVTGVRGGFGGGHDALDPDGKGISTSVFYDKNHVGAYTYGGAKGGHTYVIDARKLDGYHLYANDYAARYPNGPEMKLSPVEINYATDIPPSAIIGAYNKDGAFIANVSGIRKAARADQAKIERQLARRALRRIAAGERVEQSAIGWLPIQ